MVMMMSVSVFRLRPELRSCGWWGRSGHSNGWLMQREIQCMKLRCHVILSKVRLKLLLEGQTHELHVGLLNREARLLEESERRRVGMTC